LNMHFPEHRKYEWIVNCTTQKLILFGNSAVKRANGRKRPLLPPPQEAFISRRRQKSSRRYLILLLLLLLLLLALLPPPPYVDAHGG
jgi:hypothetical protein